MYPVWCGLHDTFNTSGFNVRFPRTPPPPQKNEKKIEKMFVHQITSIFDILLSFGVILKCLWGLEAYTVKLGYIKLGFYEYMVYIEVLSRPECNPIYFHVK